MRFPTKDWEWFCKSRLGKEKVVPLDHIMDSFKLIIMLSLTISRRQVCKRVYNVSITKAFFLHHGNWACKLGLNQYGTIFIYEIIMQLSWQSAADNELCVAMQQFSLDDDVIQFFSLWNKECFVQLSGAENYLLSIICITSYYLWKHQNNFCAKITFWKLTQFTAYILS